MKLNDIKAYEDWKAKNTDGYGACVFRYLECWANMMEEEMNQGKKLKDI